MTRPYILGLTGSIGMGKSTVSGMFAALGIPVFDADGAVRQMQGPGGALVSAIEAAFPGTTGEDGVDRDKLSQQVFGYPSALARLEAIVHPAVARERAAFLHDHADDPLVVLDIPLLFEKNLAHEVDATLVVSAPAETQRARVLRRPGMTPGRLDKILALQVPDAQKRARADYLIDTSGSLAETRRQVSDLVESLAR